MYVPAHFRLEDTETILQVIRENSFATLVTTTDGVPFATHVPLLAAAKGDVVTLRGHLARANPQAQSLSSGVALAIFAGPHAYVSPRHYVSENQVPTWNYVTVHTYGTPQVLDEPEVVDAHLREMVLTYDPSLEAVKPDSLAPELLARLRRGVVVFEILVDRIEAKAKMSQNKPEADRVGVIQALQSEAPDVAAWVTRFL